MVLYESITDLPQQTLGCIVAKKKPQLHLVSRSDELFPYDDAAFQQMKAAGLTVFRLPAELLPTLQHSLLSRVPLRITPFRDVYVKFMEFFIDTRLSAIPNLVAKPEQRLLYLAFDHADLELANPIIQEFGFVLGRYGVKVSRENRTVNGSDGKPQRSLVKLTCSPDPDINPSVYFKDAIQSTDSSARLNLSGAAALVFNTRPSTMTPGRLALSVSFEDKFGDEWVQAFVREFSLSGLDRAQLVGVFNYLLTVYNQSRNYEPPVTPKTKRD